MPPKPQRSYPRINGVKDNDTRQALVEIWNVLHPANEANADVASMVDEQSSTLSNMQSTIASLEKRLAIAEAGGGITIPSAVGGAGSGGTSGGSGSGVPGGGSSGGGTPTPPPESVPNFSGDVAQAKADLIMGGIPTTGSPCNNFQIAKLAAWRLSFSHPEIGLLAKPSGNNCDGYATDIIVWKPLIGDPIIYIFDVLGDAEGAQTPTWNYKGGDSPDRYLPPIPGAI